MTKLLTKRIICLYGGPGAGKSTTCGGLFYKLKLAGYDTEMVREYIKNWVWEHRPIKPGDQTYFFAKQSRLERVGMENNLDFIVTDSPLILTHFYGLKNDVYEQKSNTSLMMLRHHHKICEANGYKVDHFILQRSKTYNPNGRFEDEETAKLYDTQIRELLDDQGISYNVVVADDTAVDTILSLLPQEV